VWRDGAEKDVTVELGKRPDDVAKLGQGEESSPAEPGKPNPSALDDLGLQLEPSKDGAGAAVAAIEDDSALNEKLNVGDIILEVSGTPVAGPKDVAEAVDAARKKGSPRYMTLRVKRGEGTRYVAIPVQKG
jgi:serine protease Do